MDYPDFVKVVGLKRRVGVAIKGKKWTLNTHIHKLTAGYTCGFGTNGKGLLLSLLGLNGAEGSRETTGREINTKIKHIY